MERNRLSAVHLKILDIYSFNFLAKIKKMAITCTVSSEVPHHLVGKEKVAEQHILTKYSKCNRFRVRSHLLKLAKSAVTYLALGQVKKT